MKPPPTPTARRTFTPSTAVTLLAGAHRLLTAEPPGAGVVYHGRTAALLAELATNAHLLEGLEFGTVHLDLTPKKVTLRVERVCQPLHLAETPGNP